MFADWLLRQTPKLYHFRKLGAHLVGYITYLQCHRTTQTNLFKQIIKILAFSAVKTLLEAKFTHSRLL
ncbi:hypothetical protein CYG48_08900 [Neorhizobium sp. SOG26]|nr:hypothetical protein CYG48_08900 [Neorhizobium sp. SOG26]